MSSYLTENTAFSITDDSHYSENRTTHFGHNAEFPYCSNKLTLKKLCQ